MAASSSSRSACLNPGCVSSAFLRPAPGRRDRPGGSAVQLTGPDLGHPRRHRGLRHPRRPRHRRDPAAPQRPRLRPQVHPPRPLVRDLPHHRELRRQHRHSILRNRHSTSWHAKTRNHYLITDKPMRVLFFRDHEISGLGRASADPAEAGVRAAGRAGPGREAGEDCAAGQLVPRRGTGSVPRPGASTIWPPDTAAALSLSRPAGAARDLSAANPVVRGAVKVIPKPLSNLGDRDAVHDFKHGPVPLLGHAQLPQHERSVKHQAEPTCQASSGTAHVSAGSPSCLASLDP